MYASISVTLTEVENGVVFEIDTRHRPLTPIKTFVASSIEEAIRIATAQLQIWQEDLRTHKNAG